MTNFLNCDTVVLMTAHMLVLPATGWAAVRVSTAAAERARNGKTIAPGEEHEVVPLVAWVYTELGAVGTYPVDEDPQLRSAENDVSFIEYVQIAQVMAAPPEPESATRVPNSWGR